MAEYVLRIVVEGQDKSGVKTINNLGKSLKTLGRISLAALAAGLGLVAVGIGKIAFESIDAASQLQELTIALETLLAREMARGDEALVTSRVMVQLSKGERKELQKKMLDYDQLAARIQETRQRIIELSQADGGLDRLDVKRHTADLAEMEYNLGELGARIGELQDKEGSWATTSEKVRVNQMDLNVALEQAKGPALELLNQLRDLSLLSPYQFNQIADTFRFAMALGATSSEAVGMTESVTDMAAALGLNNEQLDRMQYNLAQAVIAGDLTNINLRQLKLVGVDLAAVFEDTLGMSIQQVRDQMKAGKLDYKDLAQAFQDYTQKYFGGAAERMTQTFTGMRNNLKDLFFFLGADLLGPTLDKLSKILVVAFDKLRNALESGKIAEIGEKLTKVLGPFMVALGELVQLDVKDFFLNIAAGFRELLLAMGLDREAVTGFVVELYKFFKNLFGLDAESEGGGIAEFLTDLANDILPKLTDALEWANENWDIFSGMLKGVGAVLAGGAIIGILLTLASALASPIALLIGLGAAIGAIAVIWEDDIKDAISKITGFFEDIVNDFEESGVAGVLNTISALFGDIITAFQDEGVAGAIEEFKELWPTIKTKIGEALDGIWTLIKPKLETLAKELLGWGTETINALFGTDVDLEAIATDIVNGLGAFATAVDTAMAAIENAYDVVIGGAWEKIVAWFTDNKDDLTDSLSSIGDSLGRMGDSLKVLFDYVLDNLPEGNSVLGTFGDILGDLVITLADLAKADLSKLAAMMEAAAGDWERFAAVFADPDLEHLNLGAKIDKWLLEELGGVWEEDRFGTGEEQQEALRQSMQGFLTALPDINWDEVFPEGWSDEFWKSLVDTASDEQSAIPHIKNFISGAEALLQSEIAALELEPINIDWDKVLEEVKITWRLFWGGIGEWITIDEALESLGEWFAGFASGIVQKINEQFTGESGIDLGPAGESAMNSFLEGVKGWWESSPLIEEVKALWDLFWGDLEESITIDEAIQPIIDFVADAIALFEGLYKELIGESIIPDMIDDIIDAFKAMPGDIASAVEGEIQKLVDLGGDFVKGIKQGIEDEWDNFVKWVVGQLPSIIQGIRDFFKSDSPSKLMAEESANWVAGLKMGWENSFGALSASMNRSLGSLTPSLQMSGLPGAGQYPGQQVQHTEYHNWNVNSAGAAGLALAIVEQQREERLNTFMGG